MAILLIAGWILAAAYSPLMAQDRSNPSEQPLSGEAILVQACLHCHDFSAISVQRKSEAEWRRTINDMVGRGAQILSPEVDVLAGYLGRHPLATSRVTEIRVADFPEAPGRRLIERACLDCHGAEIIFSKYKTVQEWSATMEKMMELGTELTEAEVQQVTDYLVEHLGPGRGEQ